MPLGEVVFYSFFDTNELGISSAVETALEHRKELILLDPHPEATGIDHDFQSPTFKRHIKEIIDDYYDKNGEYE